MSTLPRPLGRSWATIFPIESTPSRSRPSLNRLWWTTILVFGILSATPLFAEAQSSTVNETLAPSDSRIAYAPPLTDWIEETALGRAPYLRTEEFVNNGGTHITIANVNLTFRGSTVYYRTPLFPLDIGVRVSIDGSPAYRLPLFDNFTSEAPDGTDTTGGAPSIVHTFKLAENLDVGSNHVVQLTSDTTEDNSFFMVVGQFILTSPPPGSTGPNQSTDVDGSETDLPPPAASKGPNFKVILPLAIILPLIFIVTLTAGFCLFQRRAKSRIAPSSSYLQNLASQTTNRSRGTTKTNHVSGRRGTNESVATGKTSEVDGDGEELGEYTVPAAAFLSDRKSPSVPYKDLSPTSQSHPYATAGYSPRRQASLDTSNSFARSAGSHGTSTNDMVPLVPAKLTQANLSQLGSGGSSVSSHPSNGGLRAPPISVLHSPTRGRHQSRHRDQQSVVSAANTAELLARDIPYAPYLHTLAASQEGRESRFDSSSRAGSRADQLSDIQEKEYQGSQKGGFFGPHIPSRFDDPSTHAKKQSDPFSSSSSSSHHTGLYPTYFPQADPTAQLVASGAQSEGDNSSLGKLKPNRRRRSGDGDRSEAEYGSDGGNPWASTRAQSGEVVGLPPGAAAPYSPGSRDPPASPPKSSNLNSRPSLRRKAVPTMQELEKREASDASKTNSSGESLHLQIQPRPDLPTAKAPQSPPNRHHRTTSSTTSESTGVRPLPARPRPLPQAPGSTEGSTFGSPHPSPPPSSYHATAGHSERPRPSGGRSQAKESAYDPVWYPDRVPDGATR